MIIANPIYNSVFKYLMEDVEIAKYILSLIINKEIIDRLIDVKDKALEQKDRIIEENAKAMEEKDKALEEKDRLIKQLQSQMK